MADEPDERGLAAAIAGQARLAQKLREVGVHRRRVVKAGRWRHRPTLTQAAALSLGVCVTPGASLGAVEVRLDTPSSITAGMPMPRHPPHPSGGGRTHARDLLSGRPPKFAENPKIRGRLLPAFGT